VYLPLRPGSSGVDRQITPLHGKMTGRNIMSNEINHERRRFFGAAAMTLAAAQFGLVRSASAQSKAAGPPAVNTGEFFPGFSTELVETSGTTIHVLRKGIGRPLLLLHGYPETHLTWHKVAPQLAEQFSVVCRISAATAIQANLRAANGTRTIHFARWRRTRSM